MTKRAQSAGGLVVAVLLGSAAWGAIPETEKAAAENLGLPSLTQIEAQTAAAPKIPEAAPVPAAADQAPSAKTVYEVLPQNVLQKLLALAKCALAKPDRTLSKGFWSKQHKLTADGVMTGGGFQGSVSIQVSAFGSDDSTSYTFRIHADGSVEDAVPYANGFDLRRPDAQGVDSLSHPGIRWEEQSPAVLKEEIKFWTGCNI